MRMLWLLGVLFACVLQSAQAAPQLLNDAQLSIKQHDFIGAEAQLKKLLDSDPSNTEANFWLAKVLAWQGHFAESTVYYEQLLAKSPNNTDYQLGKAQVLVWSGKPKEALPIIETAQALNPADSDIAHLHIQALLTIGDEASVSEANKQATAAKQLFPEQSWAIVTQTRSSQVLDALDHDLLNTHSNQIEAGFSYDSYSKNRGNGRLEYLSFEHRFAPRKLIYGTLQESEKFNKNDLQLLVGGYYPLPSGMTLNLEAAISGTHKIVPRDTEMASLQVPLTKGWFITGGLRHSEYTNSHSYQEFATLERYFSDYRIAYTLTTTQAQGSTLFGNRLSLSRYYNDISYVTLMLGAGREVERNLGQNIFSDTTSIGVNGRHWFNKDWALAWSLGSTRQDTAYTRTGGSLGIRHAF
jgi:YaiO family outer membrane protein